LSEEKKSTQSESTHLLESPYVYVNRDGDVILKETSLFDERKITTVDPDSAETQVKALENAFENVKAKTDSFFNDVSEAADLNEKDIRRSFDELKEEILASDAIGDFESLIKESQERFEKIFEDTENENEAGEKETDTEAASDSTADEGEAENTPESEVINEEAAGEGERKKKRKRPGRFLKRKPITKNWQRKPNS